MSFFACSAEKTCLVARSGARKWMPPIETKGVTVECGLWENFARRRLPLRLAHGKQTLTYVVLLYDTVPEE